MLWFLVHTDSQLQDLFCLHKSILVVLRAGERTHFLLFQVTSFCLHESILRVRRAGGEHISSYSKLHLFCPHESILGVRRAGGRTHFLLFQVTSDKSYLTEHFLDDKLYLIICSGYFFSL